MCGAGGMPFAFMQEDFLVINFKGDERYRPERKVRRMQSLLDIAAQVVAGEFTCAEIECSAFALDEPMLKKVTRVKSLYFKLLQSFQTS